MNQSLISITEAAEILGVHPNTLRRWDKLGILKSVRIGERGDRKYTKESLKSVVKKGRNQFKGPQVKDIPHVGVGVLILNNKNEVLMSKRNQEYGRGEYTFPGGRIAFGESPKEAAKKEVRARVGLEIDPKPFCTVFTSKYLEQGEHPVTITFIAKIKKKIAPQKGWQWYKMNQLPKPLFGPCVDAFKCLKKKEYFNF